MNDYDSDIALHYIVRYFALEQKSGGKSERLIAITYPAYTPSEAICLLGGTVYQRLPSRPSTSSPSSGDISIEVQRLLQQPGRGLWAPKTSVTGDGRGST